MAKPARSRHAPAPPRSPPRPNGAPTQESRRAFALAAAVLVVLVFAAFRPALSAEFVSWDDEMLITGNHSFRGLSPAHWKWMFTSCYMGPYQPLGWLSLAIDHALWGLGGPLEFPEAPRYHATSIALHALASVAFLAVARRLIAAALPELSANRPRRVLFAAFVAAAAFAIHPLRVESVAWVAERRDVLCGLFYVSATWAWLRYAEPRVAVARVHHGALAIAFGAAALALVLFFTTLDFSAREVLGLRGLGVTGLIGAFAAIALSGFFAVRALHASERAARGRWYALSIVLFACALLSKGFAMALPVIFLLADVWPLRRTGSRATALVALAIEKAPFFVLALVCARLSMWGQASNYGTLASFEQHTWLERTLQAGYGLVFYPLKTLWPSSLSPIYPLPGEITPSELRFAASVLAALAITATCIVLARKRPVLAITWACFVVSVAPVLGFTQAGPQLVADRYSYFSCMPFALLAGGACLRWWNAIARAVAIAWIATLAVLTFRQTTFWHDSTSLWEHAATIERDAAISYLNLGHDRVRRSQRVTDPARREVLLREALDFFERGYRVEAHPLLIAGQALVHQQLWEIDPTRRRDEAELALQLAREALELARTRGELTPEYHLNLGSALFNTQHVDEAISELARFVDARPDHFWGRFDLGFALVRAGRFADARPHLLRATQLEPTFVNAWGNLGLAAEALGETGLAVQSYERVLALAPQHALATAKLRALRGQSGR